MVMVVDEVLGMIMIMAMIYKTVITPNTVRPMPDVFFVYLYLVVVHIF